MSFGVVLGQYFYSTLEIQSTLLPLGGVSKTICRFTLRQKGASELLVSDNYASLEKTRAFYLSQLIFGGHFILDGQHFLCILGGNCSV